MVFSADDSAANDYTAAFVPGVDFGGDELDATLYQDWDNQTVVSLGGGYGFTEKFTGRVGANVSNNPVPSKYLNALFPAIVENHLTFGAGYGFSDAQSVDFSMTYAPEVEAKNSQNMVVSTHSQLNWQIMYSHRF